MLAAHLLKYGMMLAWLSMCSRASLTMPKPKNQTKQLTSLQSKGPNIQLSTGLTYRLIRL